MLLGFELISVACPRRSRTRARIIPRTIFTAGAILAFLYMFATIGILLALPLDDLGLVTGLVDTFEKVFGTDGFGNVLVYALGIAAMYTFFTNMTTWSMGANRSAQEAAQEGELPALLAREHPVHRTPVAAYVVSGMVATAVLLFAALFVKSQDDLFYAIFSASAAVFLLPVHADVPVGADAAPQGPRRERPFRVPGGDRALLAAHARLTTRDHLRDVRPVPLAGDPGRSGVVGVHRPAARDRRRHARGRRGDRRSPDAAATAPRHLHAVTGATSLARAASAPAASPALRRRERRRHAAGCWACATRRCSRSRRCS